MSKDDEKINKKYGPDVVKEINEEMCGLFAKHNMQPIDAMTFMLTLMTGLVTFEVKDIKDEDEKRKKALLAGTSIAKAFLSGIAQSMGMELTVTGSVAPKNGVGGGDIELSSLKTECKCPHCGAPANMASGAADGASASDPDAVGVCMTCAEPCFINEDGLRKPTADERAKIEGSEEFKIFKRRWAQLPENERAKPDLGAVTKVIFGGPEVDKKYH